MRFDQAAPEVAQADAQGAEFLRMPSVILRTGLGRSTIYRLIAERQFPSPVKLAGRAVGWRRSDLDRWSEARPTADVHRPIAVYGSGRGLHGTRDEQTCS